MADEDGGLHDPWAPPQSEPVDSIPPPEAEPPAPPDVPTRAVPLDPGAEAAVGTAGLDEPEPAAGAGLTPEAIAVAPAAAAAATATAQIPVAPEPPGEPPPADTKRRWPSAAKAVAIILAVALVAACAGLGYGWWKTNQDKKDLETASNQQGQELSQQLSTANANLTKSQADLAAANKQVSDLQGQLKSAQDAATSAQAQAAALTKLFPINATTVASGVPGTYRTGALSVQGGGCSLATCPSAQLTLTVASSGGSLTVADPALGQVPLQGSASGWSATGPVTPALQLQCAGVAQPTTFTLTMSPAAVALGAQNAAQVTTLAGSLLLTAPPVAPTATPPTAGCAEGVASYVFAANRT
jgi:hypothetical protein